MRVLIEHHENVKKETEVVPLVAQRELNSSIFNDSGQSHAD